MANAVLDIFLNESLWLTDNYTWNDVNYIDGDVGSTQTDIFISLFLSVLILALRYGAQKFYFVPLGKMLGIKNYVSKTIEEIPLLENAFLTNKQQSHKQIEGWAKQLDWSEQKVKRWMRLRSKQNKPNKLDKFCESCWRCLFYSFIFSLGLCTLWNTPWLWNIKECWTNYPNHPKPLGVWLHYMLSLAFYWSLSISHFFDAKRKDFWEMFIHHIATIILITLSWTYRIHRIGTLVLLTHDFVDIPLEAAKIFNYTDYKKTCNVIFVIMSITWVISRLILFPFWILRSTMMDATNLNDRIYYICNGFLILLTILDIYWTKLLIKLIFKVVAAGKIEKDIRSSDSDSSD